MPVSRRRLILLTASIPALALLGRVVDIAGQAIHEAARGARPAGDGTSATRCAQCGASDHTMLDPRCPFAPRVMA